MAIDDLLNEHEQGERVRGWLRNNGAALIGGVLLGLAVIVGWQWWQRQHQQQNEQANLNYEKAIDGIAANDLKKAEAAVASLGGKGDVYSELAALQLAKAQVEAGQRDAAITTLRAASQPDSLVHAIVQQRLARLLIDAGKHEDALKVLADAKDPTSLEIRGDALMAGGKLEQARVAYTQAMTGLDVASPQRRLLELKLSEAGGVPPNSGEPA